MEEHRGRTDKPQDPKAADGYVREDYAIALAKKAGFVLVAKSEINANPKDTKDWPDGVWTLPPTLLEGTRIEPSTWRSARRTISCSNSASPSRASSSFRFARFAARERWAIRR